MNYKGQAIKENEVVTLISEIIYKMILKKSVKKDGDVNE